jgi:hypothetical protein
MSAERTLEWMALLLPALNPAERAALTGLDPEAAAPCV